jgi:hypothetical protein
LASISGSNFKSYMQEENASHLGTGVIQGGTVFAKSMVNGVINLGKKPLEGIQAGSVSQTAVGVVSGVSGLGLAPVIGILGFTAKLSQGIDSSTHIFDEKPHGRRRPARALFHDPKLKPLSRSIIFNQFSLHFKGLEMFDTELDLSSEVYLSVAYGSQQHSSPVFKLRSLTRAGTASSVALLSQDHLFSFHFHAEMDMPSFRTQLLKVKMHLVGSSRFGGGKTVAKCYVHPVDIMAFFQPVLVCLLLASSLTQLTSPRPRRKSPPLVPNKATVTGAEGMPSLTPPPPTPSHSLQDRLQRRGEGLPAPVDLSWC